MILNEKIMKMAKIVSTNLISSHQVNCLAIFLSNNGINHNHFFPKILLLKSLILTEKNHKNRKSVLFTNLI